MVSTKPAGRTLEPDLVRARFAVYVAFTGSGIAFASWASRIPQVKQTLGLDPGQLGLVLLSIAIGSVIALPLAGIIVTRVGAATTITVMAVVLSVGLAVVAVGHHRGVPPVVLGLFLVGFGNGIWDVAMNVEGAAVEQRLGFSIMSRFHAGFSFGTVAGALIGAAAVAGHVPVTTHLLIVAIVVGVCVPLAVRVFCLPSRSTTPSTPGEATRSRRGPSPVPCWSAWSCCPPRSPRAPATTGSA